jgi:hypothetical protein
MSDSLEIVEAAFRGRVHKLLVIENRELAASTGLTLDGNHVLRGEDLINVAVTQTLRTGGDVALLPADVSLETGPLAAILRY